MWGSEDLSQDCSRRVINVFRGRQKGDGLVFGGPLYPTDQAGFWFGLQLLQVAAAELLETGRLMSIPFTKFGAWSNFLDPFIVKEAFFGDSPWPQSIDKNSETILRIRILVYPSNLQSHPQLPLLAVCGVGDGI